MRYLAYARLLRLPNVFTAFADIGVGIAATLGDRASEPGNDFVICSVTLALASAALYLAGMVFNDFFDYEEDKRDRPFRPLPSGAIRLSEARVLGLGLIFLAIAVLGACFLAQIALNPAAPVLALILLLAILLYNWRLKRTIFGPVTMASCRFLNILFGFTLVKLALIPWLLRLHTAAIVGLYIWGITWFARTEQHRSNSNSLTAASSLIALALVLTLLLPFHLPANTASFCFPYVLVIFGFGIGVPIRNAIVDPSPARVQTAVKRCILGLIVLDAILASAFAGSWGFLILLLLPPALRLGKWVYST